MPDEQISNLREKVASLEGAITTLETKMLSGDDNVRNGIEILKVVTNQLATELREVKGLLISEDGKNRIFNDLRELKEGMGKLDEKLDAHLSSHATDEGYDNALKNLKNNWIQPVATAIIVSILIAIAGLVARSI